MPTLCIGRAKIDYDLRRTATASERRITVTPGRVEVLALATDDDDDVRGFLDRKRRWVFDTVREMEKLTADRHIVPRFMTGSKIPFRGRRMSLTVRRSDSERIEIAYRNGFLVDLPAWAGRETDSLVASELKLWLKQRARRDVGELAKAYTSRFGLMPRSVQVEDLASGWGSCGPDGNILINWHLIFAPRKVLEYVVVHELAHLRHRSHEREFWNFLGILMPDFEASKAWLDKHDPKISADFLSVGR